MILFAVRLAPSTGDNGERLKPGMSNALQTMFKAAFNRLLNYFTVKNDQQVKKTVYEFKEHYLRNKTSLLGEVEPITIEKLAERRQVNNLINQNDVDLIKNECLNHMQMIGKSRTETEFCSLRRAVVTFLILFNGRRPCEVASITLKQWDLGKARAYIPKELYRNASVDELKLLESCLIVFNTGKRSEVPVLVAHNAVIQALNFFSDDEVRQNCVILKENSYLFPSMKCSNTFSNGTENVRMFIKDHSKIKKKLSALDVRRFLSTKFSCLDLSPNVRGIVEKFFGHSLQVNEDIYSCPQAMQRTQNVAPILGALTTEDSTTTDNRASTSMTVPMKRGRMESETPPCKQYRTAGESPLFVSRNRNLDSSTSDSENEEEPYFTPSKLKRKRSCAFQWTAESEEDLFREFKSYLNGSTCYPKPELVQCFMEEYKVFEDRPDLSEIDKKRLIRIKLNNAKKCRKLKKSRAARKIYVD